MENIVLTCKVLANKDRTHILSAITNAELNVQQIEQTTAIYQPTLSQQLTVLRKAKMVSTRRDGKQIFYKATADSTKLLTVLNDVIEVA